VRKGARGVAAGSGQARVSPAYLPWWQMNARAEIKVVKLELSAGQAEKADKKQWGK